VSDRFRGRAGFNTVAALYERARPGYPAATYDDLAVLAGLVPGARVLEIGCGTGVATVPLAERGYDVLAVELGARLAAVAADRLAGFDSARVEVADFDRWECAEPPFDAVFAATSFHWLDPATRIDRTADLLQPGGALATVSTTHVEGGTRQFFLDVRSCYLRFDPSTPPGERPRPAEDLPFDRDLGTGGRYGDPVFRRYTWTVDYTTRTYLDVLGTYSGVLRMPPPTRAGLLRCIGDLIDGRYGGRITKNHLTELRVARRVR
jgi:SAM-dependent methyltransferase